MVGCLVSEEDQFGMIFSPLIALNSCCIAAAVRFYYLYEEMNVIATSLASQFCKSLVYVGSAWLINYASIYNYWFPLGQG